MSRTRTTDLEKLRVALRRLSRGALLAIAERATELVPRAKLAALVGDLVRLEDLAEGGGGAKPLLKEVRKFHEAALGGVYYDASTRIPTASSFSPTRRARGRSTSTGKPRCWLTSAASRRAPRRRHSRVGSITRSRTSPTTNAHAIWPPLDESPAPNRRPPCVSCRGASGGDDASRPTDDVGDQLREQEEEGRRRGCPTSQRAGPTPG